ncbi:MAG: hypothetical protein NT001_01300 [Candidatus Woesearchaeota archaeon]|nr:hypothetical protein [Candidatus Woesearchaeota archaeon]
MIKLPAPIEFLMNSNLMMELHGTECPSSILVGKPDKLRPFVIIKPGDDRILELSYEKDGWPLNREYVYGVFSRYNRETLCATVRANLKCDVPPDARTLINFVIYQKDGFLSKIGSKKYTRVPSGEIIRKKEEIKEIAQSPQYGDYLKDLVGRLEDMP